MPPKIDSHPCPFAEEVGLLAMANDIEERLPDHLKWVSAEPVPA
jgi:hypothetical protein